MNLTYIQQKSKNTLIAQRTDLTTFASFLQGIDYANCPSAEQLQVSAKAWQSITWQTVQSFVDWQLEAGDAITSINRRLSTIRNYAKLAAKSSGLASGKYGIIHIWLSRLSGLIPFPIHNFGTFSPSHV